MDYEYNGTQEIVDKLEDMGITCDKLKEEILHANPQCIIDNVDNIYDLHLNIFYDHEYREEFIQLDYFVKFTKEQMAEFLYHFINSGYFIANYNPTFRKLSYQDYKNFLSLTLLQNNN